MNEELVFNRQYAPQALPEMLCNLNRLGEVLTSRNLNGIVASMATNTFYLSSMTTHKSSPETAPYYVVIISLNDLQHPIMLIPDSEISRFVYQPSWINDVRPYVGATLPLDVRPSKAEMVRFMPSSMLEGELGQRVVNSYTSESSSMINVLSKAMNDLGLRSGRVAFDSWELGVAMGSLLNGITPSPGDGVLRYVRAQKTEPEIELLRHATEINQRALVRTIENYQEGMSWLDICHYYQLEVLANGGFIQSPGAMAIANPVGADTAWHSNNYLEDFLLTPGTNIMFDCHGTYNNYCWDGGKTWVVGGEPNDKTRRVWAATESATFEIQNKLAPGQKISAIVERGRKVYEQFGLSLAPLQIFFHGLGLDHLDQELMGNRDDWRLIEDMVISTHIVYRGNDHERVFSEDIALVRSDGPERFFTWDGELLVG
jgi:Xaa-Pro dipeptidase